MATALSIQPDAAPLALPICPGCTVREAIVFLSCDARYFRSAACDDCAAMYIAHFADAGVSVERLAGAPVLTTIGDVLVAQYVKACLDGATGDCDLAAMQTVPGASREVLAALSARLRRALRPSEQAAVIAATRADVVARWTAKREGLSETARRLHNPLMRIAR